MMRTWSILLGAMFATTLAGCGGGESPEGGAQPPKPGAQAPGVTTPTAQAPTATTAAPTAQGGAEDEEPAPLLAWADSDADEGKAPLTIQFTADVEGGKPPLKHVWKFGDGSPDSTEANPKHTYAKPGQFRADLEVSDSAGDSDSDYLEIDVQQ